MKKILSKIGDFFGTLFAMLVALIFGICVIFLIPIDYIKYKRSLYYKTERKKYKLYAASGVNFEIYNEIVKNDLPIKFICNPDDDSLEHGWFVYNNTLIIPNVFSFEYNEIIFNLSNSSFSNTKYSFNARSSSSIANIIPTFSIISPQLNYNLFILKFQHFIK